MDCKTFNDNIDLFVENKLDKSKITKYRKHLIECDKCRSNYITLKLSLDNNNAVFKRANKKYAVYKISAIAAAIVFLIIGSYIYFSADKEKMQIAIIEQPLQPGEQKDIIADAIVLQEQEKRIQSENNQPQHLKKFAPIYSAALDAVGKTGLKKNIEKFMFENDKLAFVKPADIFNPIIIIENFEDNTINAYNTPDLKKMFFDKQLQLKNIINIMQANAMIEKNIKGVVNNIKDINNQDLVICQYENGILKLTNAEKLGE